MQTIVLECPGHLKLTDTQRPPEPGPGEARVRVRRVGVCGTDIHAFRGEQPFFTYPRILGHELAVEVQAVGPGVDTLEVGDRCAVEPYLNCGDCQACRAGKTNCCPQLICLGVHGDGGMRDQLLLPARKLHRSAKLSLDQLTLVETLGIGKHAVSRSGVGPGDRVAVVGLGPIGLTVCQFARLAGAEVVGVDLSPSRCATAQRLLPGLDTLTPQADRPVSEQWPETRGLPPLTVLDATGHRGSMQHAFELVGPGGTVVFVGLVLGEITFDDPSFHRKELTLMGSRNSTARDFTEIIEHLEADRIDVEPWITHRAAAEEFVDAFPGWLESDAGLLKGVISF